MVGNSERKGLIGYYATRLTIFLLIGSLAMLLTEVFAGSFPRWFAFASGWLIVFPLYLGTSYFS